MSLAFILEITIYHFLYSLLTFPLKAVIFKLSHYSNQKNRKTTPINFYTYSDYSFAMKLFYTLPQAKLRSISTVVIARNDIKQ